MIRESPHGVVIDVRVIPRAERSEISGTRGNAILVRLNAAPADGAANDELIAVIAGALRVPRQAVWIVSGSKARQKRVHVQGVDVWYAQRMLLD